MTTNISQFRDAYATMNVAVYEPIIMRWVSGWGLLCMANELSWRVQKSKNIKLEKALATAHALGVERPRIRPGDELDTGPIGPRPDPKATDYARRPINPKYVNKVKLEGFPDAVRVGNRIYPYGVTDVDQKTVSSAKSSGFLARLFGTGATSSSMAEGSPYSMARSIPTTINGRVRRVDGDFRRQTARAEIYTKMVKAAQVNLDEDAEPLTVSLRRSITDIIGTSIYEFFPTVSIEEALSPIGIAHFYRQLYFNILEGYGPIEEAFTIAPLETLEVVYETVRRQVHEEIVEQGLESVSESAVEQKNLDEVSDKVSSMIQRDMSASMSANASGSIGVWQVGASASADMATSSQRGNEIATSRLKEVTKRASERITKSFTIKTRSLEELTTTNMTRRVIRNESEHPVSYGLRRVLRRVLVKVQDLGPRLVWQLYVKDPGEGLARSRFVHFREAEPIAVPEVPPGVPPRPRGGTDTGSTSSDVFGTENGPAVSLVIQTGPDRVIVGVSIDSLTDLEGGGKDDPAPSARNDIQFEKHWDDDSHTYSVMIGILPGDSASVSINYTYTWEPDQSVLDEWEAKRQQAIRELTEESLEAQFEREKTLITEKSKIKERPANELRREERFEVMNRMISQLFGRGDDPSDPLPLEIEYFNRYFDIDGMFVYLHPAWWKPRYAPVLTSLERTAYEITAESEPAPLGSSLGWMIQLDGDNRRNEFINTPWARVCLPIKAFREREAIAWLAQHVEGDIGYNPTGNPLKNLLETIDKRREEEQRVSAAGPDFVTVSSAPGAPDDPATPEGVYPIIDEFEVTVPTDGFVYDEIELS